MKNAQALKLKELNLILLIELSWANHLIFLNVILFSYLVKHPHVNTFYGHIQSVMLPARTGLPSTWPQGPENEI